MSVALSPVAIQDFWSNQGTPLVGGQLFVYAAGTTTKINTFTDSTGMTDQTNPVILNARGEPEGTDGQSLGLWVPIGVPYKLVLSPATDTDPPTNAIWSLDNINTWAVSGVGGTLAFFNLADAEAASIPAGTPALQILNYATAGDGGGFWAIPATAGAGLGKFQTADGAWWVLQPQNGVVYPEQFGAIGKGGGTGFGTINQTAIQNCVNFIGAYGGGAVVFGPFTYYISAANRTTNPDTEAADGHHIVVSYSDVSLVGVNKAGSVIHCLTYGNLNPATSWQTVDSQVWRGGGVWVQGGGSPGPTGFALRNLTLDGGSGYTGDASFPANTSTGDGWDITNKGVWFEQDVYYQNAEIEDCIIRNFRGELVYGGGQNFGTLRTNNLQMYSTNGDGLSASFTHDAQDLTIYDCANIGIECFLYTGASQFRNIDIHDITNSGGSGTGISLSMGATSDCDVQLSGIHVRNCSGGINLISPVNTSLRDSDLYDCGWASANAYGVAVFDSTQSSVLVPIRNTIIEGVAVWADTVDCNEAFKAYETGGAVTTNLVIKNNIAGVTAAGIVANVTMVAGEDYSGIASTYPNFIAEVPGGGNGVEFNNAALAQVDQFQLTSANLTTIATLTPTTSRMVQGAVTVTVTGSPSVVEVEMLWEQPSGTFPGYVFVNSNLTVGTYTYPVVGACPVPSSFVRINASAAVPANVKVSAQLLQKQQ